MKEIKAFQANDGIVFKTKHDAAERDLKTFLDAWVTKWGIEFKTEGAANNFFAAVFQDHEDLALALSEFNRMATREGIENAG